MTFLMEGKQEISHLIEKIRQTVELSLENLNEINSPTKNAKDIFSSPSNQNKSDLNNKTIYIVTSANKYNIYRDDLKIKDAIQDNQTIKIYELLNINGGIDAHLFYKAENITQPLSGDIIDLYNRPDKLKQNLKYEKCINIFVN